MSVYSVASRSMCEYTPISEPAKMLRGVCFWLSFSGVVMVCIGFLSMNTRAVIGSASSRVLPMNECSSGPCNAPGMVKNIMMNGCMSGAMLPNSSAGKLT